MDKSAIQQKIQSAILTTQEDILKFRELTQPIAPENSIGRVSRMDAINNKSINDEALRKAELKLTNLKVALSKIDDSDFGICMRCKNPIPEGRILLMPHVITCVSCSR